MPRLDDLINDATRISRPQMRARAFAREKLFARAYLHSLATRVHSRFIGARASVGHFYKCRRKPKHRRVSQQILLRDCFRSNNSSAHRASKSKNQCDILKDFFAYRYGHLRILRSLLQRKFCGSASLSILPVRAFWFIVHLCAYALLGHVCRRACYRALPASQSNLRSR